MNDVIYRVFCNIGWVRRVWEDRLRPASRRYVPESKDWQELCQCQRPVLLKDAHY